MRLLQAELPGMAVPALINLWITSGPLLVISDKHLESTRRKNTQDQNKPQTLSFLLSSRIEHAPLLFHSDLKGVGTSTHAEQLKPQTAAMGRGRNYWRDLQELIGDKKNRGQKYLAYGCASPQCSPEPVSASPGLHRQEPGSDSPGRGSTAGQAALAPRTRQG